MQDKFLISRLFHLLARSTPKDSIHPQLGLFCITKSIFTVIGDRTFIINYTFNTPLDRVLLYSLFTPLE